MTHMSFWNFEFNLHFFATCRSQSFPSLLEVLGGNNSFLDAIEISTWIYQGYDFEFKIFANVSTYSWTLAPILNWTCIVAAISPFNARILVHDKPMMHESQYVTNTPTWKGLLTTKFFRTMKIKKLLGHKTFGVKMQ